MMIENFNWFPIIGAVLTAILYALSQKNKESHTNLYSLAVPYVGFVGVFLIGSARTILQVTNGVVILLLVLLVINEPKD